MARSQMVASSKFASVVFSSAQPRDFGILFSWCLYISLSAALIFYPKHFSLVLAPVQSVHLIPHLFLFGSVFCVWLALLVGLLALQEARKPSWPHMILVTLFVVTYSAIWVLPLGGHLREGEFFAAQVDYLKQVGQVATGTVNFGYFDWPGVIVFTSILSDVTGLSTSASQLTVSLVIVEGLFSILLYLFYLRVLRAPLLASMGVLLAVSGNTLLTKLLQQFHAATFGLTLFTLALLIVVLPSQRPTRAESRGSVLLLIVLASLAIVHFISAVTLFLVLVGTALVRRLAGRRSILAYLMLAGVFPVAWLMFSGSLAWSNLVISVVAGIRNLLSNGLLNPYIFHLGRAYVGGENPAWAVLAREVWVAVVVVGGGVLGFRNFLRVRCLEEGETIVLGGMVGVVWLGVLTFIPTQGVDAIRQLIYYPVFAVLSVLVWATSTSARIRTSVIRFLAVLLIVTGLPSFLASNNTIGFDARNFPDERVAGEFLRKNFDAGTKLRIFGANFFDFISYVPFADFRLSYATLKLTDPVETSKEVWQQITISRKVLDGFGKTDIWALLRRTTIEIYLLTGRDVVHTGVWSSLEGALDAAANRLYTNGGVVFYDVP